jgi:hypothetical protein
MKSFLLALIGMALFCHEAHSQVLRQAQQQPQNVRCIKDSFGNYTCTDGTRVIHDSFDNPIVIPPRREERLCWQCGYNPEKL